MILYQYVCSHCSHVEEIWSTMGKAPSLLHCSICNHTAYREYGCNVHISKPTHESRKGRGKG